MADTPESDLARRVAATESARRYGFDERCICRISGLLHHFIGSTPQAPLSAKVQLDALDDALNAVNAAWWEVVHNPHAFSAVVGHYCDEASDRSECLERLRSALDLEPVRFAVRLARRHPWGSSAGGTQESPLGGTVTQSRDPRRLTQRLYELTRTLPGPLKTDNERRDIVQELLGIIGIELDPSSVDGTTSTG